MSADLGVVTTLGADAIGQPGQRQFRLFAQSPRGSLLTWLEKDLLLELSLTLDHTLAVITEGKVLRVEAQVGGKGSPRGMPPDFPLTPSYEFQVGRLQLSFDEEDSTFRLSVAPVDIVMESGREPEVVLRDEDAVAFTFTQFQAQQFSASITQLAASGRPTCPYCGTPLDGSPHACVKQNGHRKIIQIETAEDEE